MENPIRDTHYYRKTKKEKKGLELKKKRNYFKKMLLNRMFPFEEGKWTEEEIRHQENELVSHKKFISQKISKVHNQKKFISNLFCSHKKVIRKGDYIICTKCGAKWKVNYSVGTSK